MKTWMIIMIAVILFILVAVVVRMVGENLQWKAFHGKSGGSRFRGQVVMASNEAAILKEGEKMLEYIRRQYPDVDIVTRKIKSKGMIRRLQREFFDFLVISDQGLRELDRQRRTMKVSYTDGKISTDIVGKRVENPDVNQLMYILWDDSVKNPMRDRVIDAMLVDSSRLKDCVTDYM